MLTIGSGLIIAKKLSDSFCKISPLLKIMPQESPEIHHILPANV
jgi:hypothetical protein